MDIYRTICRVCLCPDNSKNLISLLDKTSNDGLSCFGKAAQLFANIHISPDFLPSSLCRKCLMLLQQAILFKKTCEKSQGKLETLLVSSHYSEDEFRKKLIETVMYDTVGPKSRLLKKPTRSFECLNESKTCEKPQCFQSQVFSENKTSMQAQPNKTINVKVEIEPINPNENSTYSGEFEGNFFTDDGSSTGFQEIFENPDQHVNEYLELLEAFVSKENQSKSFKLKDYQMVSEAETSGMKAEKQKDVSTKINPEEILDSIEVMIDLEEKHHRGNFTTESYKNKIPVKKLEPNKLYKLKDFAAKKTVKKATKSLQKGIWRKPARLLPKKIIKEDCICHYCNRKYANKSSLVCHIRRHTGTYSFICEHCALPFPTKSELQYHLNATHGMGKKFICDFCGFRTPKRHPLIEHIRTHTGEKPFTCEKCGIQFKHRAAWRKHRVYHTEKSVHCTLCPKKFFTKEALAAHMNGIHERKYVYACDYCDVRYARTKTLRQHIEQRHNIERALQGKMKRISLDGSKVGPARLNRRRLLQPGLVDNFPN